ncbi:MAG: AMP-binding protein, partial [Syntrophales bacterium]|nr:AMP-binding protein [Syntrophales bacterium]
LRMIIGGGGLGQAYAERMKVFCDEMRCTSSGIYGLTECTGPVTAIKGDDCFRKPDSCGKPMRGIGLQIWDDQNQPVPTGEIGEVMVRGKTTVPGYWRNEAATKELFTDDWVHTGDLGKIDEEGFVYIVDRKKDMIKTGGENVYSKEVEDVLMKHPSLADVAVIGIPDKSGWGELVTAIVVAKPGVQGVTVEDLKEFCKGKIGGYKAPKVVHTVSAIPRNAIGKVLKVELRKQFSPE